MKKGLLCLWAIVLAGAVYADITTRLNITEQDGSPSTYPYKAKFSNGTVTDNGDGTVSISNTGGGGGSPSLPFPAGATNYAQINPTSTQPGAINVSSGSILGPFTTKSITAYDYSYLDNFFMTPRSSQFAPSSIMGYSFATSGVHLNMEIFTAGGGAGVLGLYDEASVLSCGSGGFLFTTSVAGGSASQTVCISAGKIAAFDMALTYSLTVATITVSTITINSSMTVVNVSSISFINMVVQVDTVTFRPSTFSTLPASSNGTMQFCSDCTTATPATCTANLLASCLCAGSGTGAFARRINGAWYCQ